MRFAPLLIVALVLATAGVGAAGVDAHALHDDAVTPAADPGTADTPASTGPTSGRIPAATGAASDPTPMPELAAGNGTNESNATNVLAIPDGAVERSGIERISLDLGPSEQFAANASARRMNTAVVRSNIEAAESSDERSRRILDAVSDVEKEIITLHGDQRAAITAYNEGELTTEEFVTRLAAISDRSAVLANRLTMLTGLAEDTEGFSLDSSRVAAAHLELRTFGGPVRERAVAALRGKQPPTRLFVETGPEGIVLTTISHGTYVRESYRGALRNTGDGSISPSDAINVTNRSYPSIWANRLPEGTQAAAASSGQTAIVSAPHTRGNLTAFVDAGAKRVFKEYQYVPLSEYDGGTAATNVKNGLRLTVNRTYPGGPLRIHVEDAESGEPVNATITLSQGGGEGSVVGRGGDDGTVWTLSPRGGYTVFAIRGQTAAVFVEARPTDPPAVNN